jgi:hypothetical protein
MKQEKRREKEKEERNRGRKERWKAVRSGVGCYGV